MIRASLAALTLLLAVPAAAQNQQEALQSRYDRALAAGYKALMLCGAIASAERSGWPERSEESVLAMELTGIQQPLDAIVPQLPYQIVRWPDGRRPIRYVAVDWVDDMPARIAFNRAAGGCSLAPIGMPVETLSELAPAPRPEAIVNWHMKKPGTVSPVLAAALNGTYGAKARTTAVAVNWGENGWDWRFAEGFTPFTPQRTFSVAKSLAATLVGAAVHRGEAAVKASAGLGESEADPRRAITIDQLLRMASGRYSDTPGNRTDPLYYGGATIDEVALDWPLIAAPGSTYRYANNDTLAAIAAIAHTFAEHPPAELIAKIGMQDTIAETDWQGGYVLSSQVWASTMDLIRFGQLYLNDGVLPSGERILPEGWVKYVSTPSGPQPDGAFGYGASFWLLNKSEGVPPDTFAAFGNRGQYVVIVPSRQVVIVRRGEDPAGSGFDIAAFTRDVLAALPRD
jgi:CubicO group peptidase (beta-lactamase class C family)